MIYGWSLDAKIDFCELQKKCAQKLIHRFVVIEFEVWVLITKLNTRNKNVFTSEITVVIYRQGGLHRQYLT